MGVDLVEPEAATSPEKYNLHGDNDRNNIRRFLRLTVLERARRASVSARPVCPDRTAQRQQAAGPWRFWNYRQRPGETTAKQVACV